MRPFDQAFSHGCTEYELVSRPYYRSTRTVTMCACSYVHAYVLSQNPISTDDEASDLEACRMLTANAKNLTSVISEALNCTQSATIRVTEATRKELGLSTGGGTNLGEDLFVIRKVNNYSIMLFKHTERNLN